MADLWPDPDRRDAGLERLRNRTIGYRVHKNGVGYRALRLPAPTRDLTTRQIQCLSAASVGLGRHATGELLGIGVEAVADHLDHARRTLAAKTTAQAVAEALRQGLID